MRTVITRKTLGISWDNHRIQGCVIRSGIADTAIERLVCIPREQNDDLTPRHTVVQDLKAAMEQVGPEAQTIVTCLDESEIMYRTLLRPFSDRRKILDTIGSEVETLLPSMDSRLMVDFVLTGKDREGSYIIQSLCARTTSVQDHVALCRAAGMDTEIVDCPAAAVAAGARSLLELPPEAPVVVVHMGWAQTSLAVLTGKAIRHIGSLPFGFERIAASALPEEADQAARLAGQVKAGSMEGGEHLSGFFREILIMLARAGELEGEPVLLATGYARAIKDFSRGVEESLGMSVIEPALRGVQFDGSMDELLSGFLSACLACRGVDSTDEVNFRQGELGLNKHMKRLKSYAGPWVKAALALLVIWIFGLSVDVFLKARTNAMLTRKIAAEFASVMPKGTPMVDSVRQMEQHLARLSGTAGALGGSAADSPLEILKDLSAGIPADLDVLLDTINIDESSLTLSGSTNSYNNVEHMQGIIAKLPYVKEVKIVSANVDKTDQKVKLKLVCKK